MYKFSFESHQLLLFIRSSTNLTHMPKVPSNPTTKLLIARGGPSPHRGQRRVETDVSYLHFPSFLSHLKFHQRTPIHQQKFPTKRPLRADHGLVVEPSSNVIDVCLTRQPAHLIPLIMFDSLSQFIAKASRSYRSQP